MFKKILFPTTGSPSCDDAARVAFDMAKRYEAELVVFHVIGLPSRGYSQEVKDFRTGEKIHCDEDYVQWVREELKNTYDNQLKKYSNIRIETVSGVKHTEILRMARKEDADLIVMGACISLDDQGDYVCAKGAGKTLQMVAKSARPPVLVIGRPVASLWGGISNIVFCTDFSRACESAFDFAYKTAKKIKCTLHLFHACDISSIHSGRMSSQDNIEDKLMEARDKIRKQYLSRIEGIDDCDIEVWEGIPYVEIVKFAREKQADLIVMAHHTVDKDPEKEMLGSTLEQVALRGTCPVVSVNHPDKLKDL
ncbi:universal stress protein [Thermodesulfobacteriota bacterium]